MIEKNKEELEEKKGFKICMRTISLFYLSLFKDIIEDEKMRKLIGVENIIYK